MFINTVIQAKRPIKFPVRLYIEPSHIIVHAGKNNLVTTEKANSCATKIETSATKVQEMFLQAKIAISRLTSKEDVDVSTKLENVNSELRSITKKHRFYYDIFVIDSSCLNESKLHINTKGSALLAVQFIKFLRFNKDHDGTTPTKRNNSRRDFHQMSTLCQLGKFLMNLWKEHPRSRRRERDS